MHITNDGYNLSAVLEPIKQDSYWLTDASIKLYSEDDHWEFALIGKNLGDEIIGYSAGPRPGACIWPTYTGSTGQPPTKQLSMSVPPEIEERQTSALKSR